ncbi:MAG: aspartate--tRNA ligase [Acholeplasmataceae bacterium]
MFKYTHHNNELTKTNINQTVFLKGWVSKRRNLGGLIFIDLRDQKGITQLIIEPNNPNYEKASTIRSEFVIEVKGVVKLRSNVNKHITTGEIEVIVDELNILSEANNTPITIFDDEIVNEDIKLKYRYLDLRKPSSSKYLITRSKITQSIRNTLINEDFLELETPYLVKTTPEGAKEFIIPSRLYKGSGYALAQSPQIFKQLYMISGFERYFQFARCFRDEALRADRQLEFTQVDIEASFIDESFIFNLVEKILKDMFNNVLKKDIDFPLQKITYEEAIKHYGSDSPDLRYQLKIKDYQEKISKYEIPFLKEKESIRGLILKENDIFTRKYFDILTKIAKQNHGDTLAYVKRINNELTGSIAKFVDLDLLNENEVLIIVPGKYHEASLALGAIRKRLANDLSLIDENKESLLWVTDFPLLEYDKEEKRFNALHHPFTSPKNNDDLKNNPENALAKAYDIVWNGYEIGGGSIRIHNSKVQELMFKTLGLSPDEIKTKFGFFNEALTYGTPPHGGIAFGLDRIIMLATKTDNIRDVIAFPKTQSARDLMTDSPSPILKETLDEIHMEIKDE